MYINQYKQWASEQECCDCGEKAINRKSDMWVTETQCYKCWKEYGSPEGRGLPGAKELFEEAMRPPTDSDIAERQRLAARGMRSVPGVEDMWATNVEHWIPKKPTFRQHLLGLFVRHNVKVWPAAKVDNVK